MSRKIHHKVGKNLDLAILFSLDPYKRSSAVLDLVSDLSCDVCAFICKDFSCRRIHNCLCKLVSYNPAVKMKFFVKFITSDFGKVISSRIKEHCHDQALCALHCQRLTRTDFFV